MRWINQIKQSYLIVGLGFLLACLMILFVVMEDPVITPLVKRVDGFIYDVLIGFHVPPRPRLPRVVIINIDEHAVAVEGRWPWPRRKLATLIDKLKEAGVVTIGLDLVMSEPETNMASGLKSQLKNLPEISSQTRDILFPLLDNIEPLVDSDKALTKSLVDQNTVLGYSFHHQAEIKRGGLPAPLLDKQGQALDVQNSKITQFEGYHGSYGLFMDAGRHAGFVTHIPDVDGTVRHAMLVARYNNQLYPSLALAVAMHYLKATDVKLQKHQNRLYNKPDTILLGNLSISTDAQVNILIPYWGSPGTFDYYSATDVLNGRVGKKDLQGSIALIGSSMPSLGNLHQSPKGQLFPNVEIVANVVQGILGQSVVHEYHWHTKEGIIILVLTGLFFAIFFLFLGSSAMLLVSFLTLLLIVFVLLFLFVVHHIYVPSGWLFILTGVQMLVNFSFSFILERRQRKKVSQLFGQYVPATYVKELIETHGQIDMAGETRNMTVLFSDIRNFTTISENLDAVAVKQLLNAFFTPLTKIIFDNHGTIDKYVGDMIVAFWGAPLSDLLHTEHAINSALKMLGVLPEINAALKRSGLPEVHFGIGLTVGMMNVGDMGSEFRRAYTVIGDTVNLASRLQDLTKFYQVPILVGEQVKMGRDQYSWRFIDKVIVKGRQTALKVYQPMGFAKDATPDLLAELEMYHEAQNRYYAKDWSGARYAFQKLSQDHPQVYLYRLYLQRIELYQNIDLPEDWDSVYIHEHK